MSSVSESDSILYTIFWICEGKNHRHLKNIDIYSQTIYIDKIFKRSLHILEDGAKCVQVDNIEQVTI
jgi:hypothetical protein